MEDPPINQTSEGDQNLIVAQANNSNVVYVTGSGNNVNFHGQGSHSSSLLPRARIGYSISREEFSLRQELLDRVHDYWVEGLLTHSFHKSVLAELNMPTDQDLIELILQDCPEFSETNGRTLLILGEPGSGKTTILMKMAKDLITHTKQDLRQQIPVVFNLSSWARESQTIEEWLVCELSEKYQVSTDLGWHWVDTESLILLLDGLDEVKAKYQNACVQALNKFLGTHGNTELIVCCRTGDYQTLTNCLTIRKAVCVQPLISKQIRYYFEKAGEQLNTLSEWWQEDWELSNLSTSPFMLNIMCLAYQNCELKNIARGGTKEDYRKRLFSAYIYRMLQWQETVQKIGGGYISVHRMLLEHFAEMSLERKRGSIFEVVQSYYRSTKV
jgi:energy-coupling factor transporter ATP-binding protein EcfA2